MSINWVMTSPSETGFVKLPNERILYTSPPRISLQISTPGKITGVEPFSKKCDAGVVYISNQRIVYLPSNSSPEFQSFSSPIFNLQDTYVHAPYFGANYWTALCKPVSGGGIPPDYPIVEIRMTFREGGAFDFHSCFEQIKERLYQAYTVAREHGQRGTTAVDLASVDIEPLPAYEPAREVADEVPVVAREGGVAGMSPSTEDPLRPETFTAPAEPPPDYEEAQAQAVSVDLDQRLREQAERQ